MFIDEIKNNIVLKIIHQITQTASLEGRQDLDAES